MIRRIEINMYSMLHSSDKHLIKPHLRNKEHKSCVRYLFFYTNTVFVLAYHEHSAPARYLYAFSHYPKSNYWRTPTAMRILSKRVTKLSAENGLECQIPCTMCHILHGGQQE